MSETSMLLDGKSEPFFTTTIGQESPSSIRGLTENEWEDVKAGAQIKLRFDTSECLTASAGSTAKFDECEDHREEAPYQYWELKRSYLISSYLYWKDREEWCLTYVPSGDPLKLTKCQFGNNLQRFRYDGFNHFRSFYDNNLCLEYSDGKALLEECDTFKDEQAFLFKYY